MNLSRQSPARLRSTVLRIGLALSISAPAAGAQQRTASAPQTASPLPPPPLQALPPAPAHSADSASLPAPSPYRISGVVVDTVTKSPVSNVNLTVGPMNTGTRNRAGRRFQNQADSATTDSEGHFELAVPSAGGWALAASARGYHTQALDEHDGYSTAVILTEAEPRFNVTFHMMPASIIQGFILDEAGEAVRGANVTLIYLSPATPDNPHRRPQSRAQQTTDDRGFYKFDAIAPGDYDVRVTAHPWYATSTSNFSGIGGSAFREEPPANPGPDPLDVVYPIVWYPGVADPSTATPITLRGGDTREADFRLLPIPGSHLRIGVSVGDAARGEREARPQMPNTYLTRILPDGTEDTQISPTRLDSNGNAEIPGLSPGTYLVHQQSPSGNIASLATIQVGAGSPRTLDLSEGTPSANVTVKVDPAADQDSLQISFRDAETGHTFYAQRFQEGGGAELRRRSRVPQREAPPQDASIARPDRTVSLPPGKYDVFLNGVGNDIHLAGIEATGATATGRTVTIGAGAAKLLLHTASGRGTVTGTVTFHGQPDPGAMVMLVPATLGDPAGIDIPSRDQSNSDGSFEMTGMIPGGYILIAIDHGWDVNWADPSTLRRYLLHGVPLDVKPGSDIRKTVEAE